jgi:putative Holliday junction resolvase
LGGRILAVDPGSRRVGLALSDEMAVIPQPLGSLRAEPTETLAQRLAERAAAAGAREVVVGLPRRLDGSAGPEAVAARELAARLRQCSGLPVHLLDERLTTAQAERQLIAQGVSRDRRKQVVDGAAAALLLEAFLVRRTRAARRGER